MADVWLALAFFALAALGSELLRSVGVFADNPVCWVTISLGSTLYRRALMQTQGRVTIRQALKLTD